MKRVYGSLLAVATAILFYRLLYSSDIKSTNLSEYLDSKEVTESFHSSIWCEKCHEDVKCCEMQNIIFFPQEKSFVFVMGDGSVLHGISSPYEMINLITSSVLNHTELYLPLVIMSPNDDRLKLVRHAMERPVYLLYRFKPDNIMHILHDDLLPLFTRYEVLCHGDVASCVDTNLLAFVDPLMILNFNIPGVNALSDWYQLLTSRPPINLYLETQPLILTRAHVGLPGVTVGFQYGFGQPQGPLQLQETSVAVFERFAAFVKMKLHVKTENNKNSRQALLVSRKQTRKILNEPQVLGYIQNAYVSSMFNHTPLHTTTIDLQVTTRVDEVVAAFSSSDLVIGMHGASMYLAALFSKSGSALVELFPYGIQPQVVSPILSLSQLTSCWFVYSSWENTDSTTTVPPDNDAAILLGGLGHLNEKERRLATETVPVPAVPCCHHSAYLHRMYQDTFVGPSFQETVRKALITLQDKKIFSWSVDFIVPARIWGLDCIYVQDAGVTRVSWKAPLNLSSFNKSSSPVYYDIIATSISGSQLEKSVAELLEIEFNDILTSVWVRACSNLKCGKDSYAINCKK